MAQTSYLSKIIARFISSTIGQVGRDFGKTISNRLFGDAHSTPIRHVRNDQRRIANNESKQLARNSSTSQVEQDSALAIIQRITEKQLERKQAIERRQKKDRRDKLLGVIVGVSMGALITIPLLLLIVYLLRTLF